MQTHFALWSFAKSPLFLAFNFNSMPAQALTIVTNPLLVALNQDSAGNMPKCVMNCKTQTGTEVFKVDAVDQGGYSSLLAVNWDSQAEASINLDLVLLGVIPAYNYKCNVTNMWYQSISTMVSNGLYSVTKIAPNGNAAFKFACTRPFAQVTQEEEEEERFLF
jgi:hypothetical protein